MFIVVEMNCLKFYTHLMLVFYVGYQKKIKQMFLKTLKKIIIKNETNTKETVMFKLQN